MPPQADGKGGKGPQVLAYHHTLVYLASLFSNDQGAFFFCITVLWFQTDNLTRVILAHHVVSPNHPEAPCKDCEQIALPL
mmetsp:Transcript_45229/g.80901  ORF Transcript_45229/g.80901 Transcript_45229/m.80901 type:complete len:80 (+) Transcript_45229:391-630(+)